MKIKTATKWGLIGAIAGAVMSLYYLMYVIGLFSWSPALAVLSNILNIFSSCTLAMFFYVLYKNQK